MTPRDWTQAACCLAVWALIVGATWSVVTHSPWPALASCVPAGLAMLADFIFNGAEQ